RPRFGDFLWRGLFFSYYFKIFLLWVKSSRKTATWQRWVRALMRVGPAQQAGPTKIVRICSRNPATIDRGNRRRIVLLQTLETRDFDELALALPLRNLRFRQLGRGAFRGELQFLKLEGVEVFRVAFNRMVHTQGWPSPDSFACAPVLAANENSVWRGWRQ